MKLCIGCKHHVKRYAIDLCSADDPEWVHVTDPHTGIERLEPVGGYRMRHSVATMRTEGGKCGPDASLWKPNLRRRFMFLLTRRESLLQPKEQ